MSIPTTFTTKTVLKMGCTNTFKEKSKKLEKVLKTC
uniref:Uncharacterized protein n=1 Tax=Siphoviridae sp. ctL0q1 TaxID=2825449 RepID=A0A8S5PI24_9CAUD|nr:MAG TPA: hypothetical protein [Siphoviridae sp. ctL0q1]